MVAPVGFPSLELAAQSVAQFVAQSVTLMVYIDPKLHLPLPKQDMIQYP